MNLNALLGLIPVDIKSFMERKRRDVKAIALSILLYHQEYKFEETPRTTIVYG